MPWHNILLVFSQKFYTIEPKNRHGNLILGFIKPIIDHFAQRNLLKSFHFFYEGNRLELRLELGDGVSRDEVKNALRTYLNNVADLVDAAKSDVGDYEPEVKDDQYGIEGWEIAKKIFEYGSRLAIGLVDPKFRKGELLREGKLIHCMLNSLGYGAREEKKFHITQAIEREIIIMSRERGVRPENVDLEEAKQRVEEHIHKMKIYRKTE